MMQGKKKHQLVKKTFTRNKSRGKQTKFFLLYCSPLLFFIIGVKQIFHGNPRVWSIGLLSLNFVFTVNYLSSCEFDNWNNVCQLIEYYNQSMQIEGESNTKCFFFVLCFTIIQEYKNHFFIETALVILYLCFMKKLCISFYEKGTQQGDMHFHRKPLDVDLKEKDWSLMMISIVAI